MARTRYMLDTNICSFIIRQRPLNVLDRLQEVSTAGDHICISAITYAELLFGANNKRASPKWPALLLTLCPGLTAYPTGVEQRPSRHPS